MRAVQRCAEDGVDVPISRRALSTGWVQPGSTGVTVSATRLEYAGLSPAFTHIVCNAIERCDSGIGGAKRWSRRGSTILQTQE